EIAGFVWMLRLHEVWIGILALAAPDWLQIDCSARSGGPGRLGTRGYCRPPSRGCQSYVGWTAPAPKCCRLAQRFPPSPWCRRRIEVEGTGDAFLFYLWCRTPNPGRGGPGGIALARSTRAWWQECRPIHSDWRSRGP